MIARLLARPRILGLTLALLVALLASAGPARAQAADSVLTGELTVMWGDDFDRHRSELLYELKEARTGAHYRLKFQGRAPAHLRNGSTVKVKGKASGREFLLAADATGSSGSSVEVLAAAAAPAIAGEQRTIVLLANFTDSSLTCTQGAVQNLMFTDPTDYTVDDLYQETSLGGVSFTGNVAGPFNLNYSAATCDYSSWASALEAAAQSQGVSLSGYNRKVYVFPNASSCGWAGLGTVGGNPSRAWILRCDLEDVFAHELGHNLGMNHSSTPSSEYGDTSDIMGYGGLDLRQVNAPHREQAGWLPAAKIAPVNQSGLYNVSPIELDPATAQAAQTLKIAKPDTNEWYYLSYRQPLGFDANLSSSYVGRLSVHRYAANGGKTYFLGALADGQSYSDAVNGLMITQVSHTAAYATVQIQMSTVCSAAAPTVTVFPASQSALAGSALSYTLSVTNNDTPDCAGSTFTLGASLPSGWTASASPASLTLLPGATGTATLAVRSSSTAAAGSYGFNPSVSDAVQPAHSAWGSATYVVLAPPDTTPPTAPTGLTATQVRKQVKLAWKASTDNVGVAGYRVIRNGALIAFVTGTSYTDNSAGSGTVTYNVAAYDNAGNVSAASNTASMTTSSGTSRGGGKGAKK